MPGTRARQTPAADRPMHRISAASAAGNARRATRSVDFVASGFTVLGLWKSFWPFIGPFAEAGLPPLASILLVLRFPALFLDASNLFNALPVTRFHSLIGGMVVGTAEQAIRQAGHVGQFFLGVMSVLVAFSIADVAH